MKATTPSVPRASSSLETGNHGTSAAGTKSIRPPLDKAIVGNKVAEKMVEDVARAYEKYGVIDDNAVAAMFERAVIGDASAPPAFEAEKGAVAKMLARAKRAKPGDAPDGAQEAAIAHIRTHYGDKMSTDASKVLDLVDRAQQCHRTNTPIPKALIDELKGAGALSRGSASALAYVRTQYVSSIAPMLLDHIDSMLNTWSLSLFQDGLEQGAEQARRQEEDNARAFQQMLDADNASHAQVDRNHKAHVGKKHEIQFAKIDFSIDRDRIHVAQHDHEIGKEEVNERDQDYATDMAAAAETAQAHAHSTKGAGTSGKQASPWQAAMMNVRFPGTSRAL